MKKEQNIPRVLVNTIVQKINGLECEVLRGPYAQRVCDAGAVPFLIPSIEKDIVIGSLLDLADGVLLIGGPDYPPQYYEEERMPETGVNRLRPHFDLALAQEALRRGLPVLGICAGCQLLNIVCGGKLIQHLDNAENHKNGMSHSAVICRDGFLAKSLGIAAGSRFQVNSYHHQAVDSAHLGKDLEITALAFDGSVEAIELTGSERMVMGLQFHPERMDDLAPAIFRMLRDEALRFRNRSK